MSSYKDLPNEVIVRVGERLNANDLYALIRTSKQNASLLIPLLQKLACEVEYAKSALWDSIHYKKKDMVLLLLDRGAMSCISRYHLLVKSGLGNFHRTPKATPTPQRIPTLREFRKNRDLLHLQYPEEFFGGGGRL